VGKQDPATAELGGRSFDRLPASHREAENIAALAAPGQSRIITGFQANRNLVLDGSLAGYDILHLATHSLIDTRHPALSGLVLSLVDAEGRPQDGLLRLQDLYSLHLDAELVVLSGCQTALGKEIRGEGLVGLMHGFMSAGAERILASLWQVQDQATASLMSHLYENLLHQGQAPAAALRTAQLQIRAQTRWRDPYFWAAFTAHGNWR
jgi:CHAT domain-containing protein